MKRDWKEIPKDKKRPQWAGMYVTMNSKGTIVMNRTADERLGSPTAYLLFYDPGNHVIGLKPTIRQLDNAYKKLKSGRHGGQKIFAYRLLKECDLIIKDTLEFPDAEIDIDGFLILNLRTATISKRALNHPTRREKAS